MPSGPPTNVKVAVLSSSSVNVSWSDPSPDKRNGVITQFTVVYYCTRNSSCANHSYDPIIVHSRHYQIVMGLQAYSDYVFAVAAATTVDEGPFSDAIFVKTREAGELSSVCTVFQFLSKYALNFSKYVLCFSK